MRRFPGMSQPLRLEPGRSRCLLAASLHRWDATRLLGDREVEREIKQGEKTRHGGQKCFTGLA